MSRKELKLTKPVRNQKQKNGTEVVYGTMHHRVDDIMAGFVVEYFQRIQLSLNEEMAVSLKFLSKLHSHHIFSVPFENLRWELLNYRSSLVGLA